MKLVFVETQYAKGHRSHRSEYLPFVAGLADLLGWTWRWLAVRVPEGSMHAGGRFVVDLPPERRETLLRAVVAEAPDVVVTKDRLAEGFLRSLEEAAPGARVVDLSDAEVMAGAARFRMSGEEGAVPNAYRPVGVRELSVGQMVGLLSGREPDPKAREPLSELLLDAAMPRFGRTYPCEEDLSEEPLPTRVLVPAACSYGRSLRRNRFYRDLDEPVVSEHVGCSFCINAMTNLGIDYRVPPAEMALRQIEAEQREQPERAGRAEYVFDGNGLSAMFEPFFEGLLERGLGPSTITGMLRVDQLLGLRSRLEELLPRLELKGHALRLLSMGAESFSGDENERFNKGLRVEQLEQVHELITDLEERFPDTFGRADPSTFAAILFTPWTRPEDLLANVEAARRLGAPWLQTAMGTRLQLRPGLPITLLARRDGLTTEAHGSGADVEAVCLSGPDEEEIPWRFADPVTERLHQILIRVDPIPEQVKVDPEDPLAREIREACARLPGKVAGDYVGMVEAVVHAVVALGPDAPAREVLARAAREALLAGGLYDPEKGLDEYGAGLLAGLLDKLLRRNARHLRGYRLGETAPASYGDSYRVRVSFARGSEGFGFELAGRYAGNTYRLEEERFAVIFSQDEEPRPDDLAVARVTLRLAERSFPRQPERKGPA